MIPGFGRYARPLCQRLPLRRLGKPLAPAPAGQDGLLDSEHRRRRTVPPRIPDPYEQPLRAHRETDHAARVSQRCAAMQAMQAMQAMPRVMSAPQPEITPVYERDPMVLRPLLLLDRGGLVPWQTHWPGWPGLTWGSATKKSSDYDALPYWPDCPGGSRT